MVCVLQYQYMLCMFVCLIYAIVWQIHSMKAKIRDCFELNEEFSCICVLFPWIACYAHYTDWGVPVIFDFRATYIPKCICFYFAVVVIATTTTADAAAAGAFCMLQKDYICPSLYMHKSFGYIICYRIVKSIKNLLTQLFSQIQETMAISLYCK